MHISQWLRINGLWGTKFIVLDQQLRIPVSDPIMRVKTALYLKAIPDLISFMFIHIISHMIMSHIVIIFLIIIILLFIFLIDSVDSFPITLGTWRGLQLAERNETIVKAWDTNVTIGINIDSPMS